MADESASVTTRCYERSVRRPRPLARCCVLLTCAWTASSCGADSDAPSATLISTTPASSNPTTVVPADDAREVVSFAEPASVDDWTNVDDSVMGGVSASTTSWEAGRMVFAGALSLENNGGFTSVRGPVDASLGERIGDANTVTVEVLGDGRTYLFQLRTSDEWLYVSQFSTVAAVSDEYPLELAAFEPVTRFLDPAPDAPVLDASTVVQIAVYLVDGRAGTFRLAVGGITAE